MQVAASKPDIMPDQASEQIRPNYEDIQQTLRVPLVNLIFRTLANYPDYFEPMWKEDEFSEIPLGVAEGTTKVQMIKLEKALERVRDLFASIKEKHGHPLVSSYYRGIANWLIFWKKTGTGFSLWLALPLMKTGNKS